MIGKDMTKMTLPVTFNEPTSLLQRVAEDMEYTDLLDQAAEALDSTERMVYAAAFAASEYASTIGRVAKPFNPLLAETYEYVRPDKGYRFFIEQVSHHPPIGAAYAESPRWDYYGESSVQSKFYGKSFDINPLGTWFLRLRPASGGEELYTWKKVTSSVIGIITGVQAWTITGLWKSRTGTQGRSVSLNSNLEAGPKLPHILSLEECLMPLAKPNGVLVVIGMTRSMLDELLGMRTTLSIKTQLVKRVASLLPRHSLFGKPTHGQLEFLST
jgi:hypothetical protein